MGWLVFAYGQDLRDMRKTYRDVCEMEALGEHLRDMRKTSRVVCGMEALGELPE